MVLPIGVDLRPSARTGMGTPGLGGMILAAIGAASMVFGLVRRSVAGVAIALVGAGLAYRGLTGMSLFERIRDSDSATHPRFRLSMPTHPGRTEVVTSTITINRDREPVFLFWRNPSNLTLLDGLVSDVTAAGDGRERWWLDGRGGVRGSLDMRLIEEVPFESLAWRSTDGADASFSVELRAGPAGRGTEVFVAARMPRTDGLPRPVRGLVAPLAQARLDGMLRKARALIEVGEFPTIQGQPSGREGSAQRSGGAER